MMDHWDLRFKNLNNWSELASKTNLFDSGLFLSTIPWVVPDSGLPDEDY